jgi:ribosomal-protein-alanine N-acetyltransferase
MSAKKATDFRLNKLTESDLDRILEIEQLCFSHPWLRENFLIDLHSKSSCCLAARVKEEPVGFIIGWFVMDELHILNLAVEPGHRRRGIGRKLLSALLTRARKRDCRWATLELRASNKTARELYRGFGFRPVAVRKGYYRRPKEDAVLMLMDLDPGSTKDPPDLEVPDGVVSQG